MSAPLCRLCVNPCIRSFRSLYNDNEVYEITAKYFEKLLMNVEHNLTSICVDCWLKVKDFYDFQKTVDLAQNKLDNQEQECEIVVKLEPQDFYESDGDEEQQSSFVRPTVSELFNIEDVKDEQQFLSLPELEMVDDTQDEAEFTSDNERPFVEYVISEIDDPNVTRNRVETTKPERTSFKCKLCDEIFTSKRDLNIHKNYWHSKKIQHDYKYACDECGKVYKTAKSLSKHKWYHRTKHRFKCNICGQPFLRADKLRDHSIVHSGSR